MEAAEKAAANERVSVAATVAVQKLRYKPLPYTEHVDH